MTARTPSRVLWDGKRRGEIARARRQGRPPEVMPLHVVAGFFESERGRRDSGV